MKTNKIYNMDCIEGLKELKDKCIDCTVTSPPYNIGIDYGGYDDTQTDEAYEEFFKKVFTECFRVSKEKALVCVVVGEQNKNLLLNKARDWLLEIGFNIVKTIVWFKGLYYIPHEYIIVCSKVKDYNKYYEENDIYFSNGQFSTLWKIRYEKSKEQLGHNAFFPVRIPELMLKINTKEGDLILDPFMGTGSTAVACKKLNRKFIGFEINEEYCSKANKRISGTGSTIRLDDWW